MCFCCVGGNGRFGSFRGLHWSIDRRFNNAFHEVAFLLFVLFVGASVHIFDAIDEGLVRSGFLFRHLRLLVGVVAFEHGFGNLRSKQANGAQSVVIPWNDPVDHVGVAIGIYHRNDRHAHTPRFLDRDFFGVGIDNEHGIGKLRHILDSFEILKEVLHFALEARFFFLRELIHAAIFGHGLQQLQTLDRFLQRRPVRQRATQPAVVHEKCAAALRLFGDRFLGLALSAHKKNVPSLRGKFTNEATGFAEHFQRLLKIDNVNAVAFPENILLHFRIPASCLVTEVNSGLQQLFHGNFYCQVSSFKDCCLRSRAKMLSRKNSLFAGSLPAVISASRLRETAGARSWAYTSCPAKLNTTRLALGKLEALARALLAVLLAFFHARIASQKPILTQRRAQFRVEHGNGASETHADRSSLSADSTTLGGDDYIHLVVQVREFQRFSGIMLPRHVWKIFFRRSAIYLELAGTGAQKNSRNRFLTATCTQNPSLLGPYERHRRP